MKDIRRKEVQLELVFSGAVILDDRKNPSKVLLQDSLSFHPIFGKNATRQTKFPGGTNKNHREDSTPVDTLRRELFEETGLVLRAEVEPIEIFSRYRKGVKTRFYLLYLEDFDGKIRTEEADDPPDKLFPPEWVLLMEAGRKLTLRSVYQEVLMIVLRRLGLVGYSAS
ncbi:MAG: NUDIX hydrolase [Nitrospira sp.]